MTNEVAAAGVAGVKGALVQGLACEVDKGRELASQTLAWLTDKGATFALNIVMAILILLLGALAIKLIGAAVRRAAEKSGKLSALLVDFICSVTTKICWAFLLVVVLSRLGVDVAPLVAGLGVTGFVIGFACQESLANLAAGFMIALNRPFKAGDFIQAAGLEGVVKELNMMATVLATPDNKKIVVPNKSVWGGPITNFSALDTRRVDMNVGIAYGADVDKAKSVARATITSLPGVLANPEPTIEVVSLDSSAVTLVLRAWAKNADYWNVYFAAIAAVKKAFDREGVAIPFPQLDVHLDGAVFAAKA